MLKVQFPLNQDNELLIRNNIYPELGTKLEIKNAQGFNTIASLYNRLKTASDNIKSYAEASWFYYNEFEMKRLGYRKRFNLKTLFKNIGDHILYFIYSIYKLFVGYGEKPQRSFLWFLFFACFLFPIIHILNGLYVKSYHFNYDIVLANFTILRKPQFWSDFCYAVGFSLYRVIPVGYLPFQRQAIFPEGPEGLIISFLNSAVLILLAIFTGIGLKRHFRRF